MIGADAEQERRAGIVLAEHLGEARHAFARSAQRVDVDLQGEEHREFGGLMNKELRRYTHGERRWMPGLAC